MGSRDDEYDYLFKGKFFKSFMITVNKRDLFYFMCPMSFYHFTHYSLVVSPKNDSGSQSTRHRPEWGGGGTAWCYYKHISSAKSFFAFQSARISDKQKILHLCKWGS